jgi:hypothetical protein
MVFISALTDSTDFVDRTVNYIFYNILDFLKFRVTKTSLDERENCSFFSRKNLSPSADQEVQNYKLSDFQCDHKIHMTQKITKFYATEECYLLGGDAM